MFINKMLTLFVFLISISFNQAFAQPASHILVIFGATGDLSQRKLMPALLELAKHEQLPEHFAVVGTGRKELTHEQFRQLVAAHIPEKDRELWDSFSQKLFYIPGAAEEDATYQKLTHFIKPLETKLGTEENRLFYLATPSDSFSPIIDHLDRNHLIKSKGWSRVVIEKPFGHDLESAIQLQTQIDQHLDPTQLYRIDHYLGKEVVHNLFTFRFANPIIEKIWNRDLIDHVSLTLSEEIGIGIRGHTWEKTGLLRDLVQNHIMQLVSIIGMEKPHTFEPADVQAEKVRLIESIRPIDMENIIRGQYGPGVMEGKQIPGYREEEGVAKESVSETFVAAKLFIDNPRWSGVPFYIKAGKRLSQKLTEIKITFKSDPLLMPNQLILRIQPQEEIALMVNSLIPGLENQMKAEKLCLPTGKMYAEAIPDAYSRLLLDAMSGKNTDFVSYQELIAAWRLFNPILQYWNEHPPEDFPNYPAGSNGPHTSF